MPAKCSQFTVGMMGRGRKRPSERKASDEVEEGLKAWIGSPEDVGSSVQGRTF